MRSSGITEGVGQKFSENCPYKRYRGELRDRADRKKIKAIFGKIQSGPWNTWSQQTQKARKDSTFYLGASEEEQLCHHLGFCLLTSDL